MKARRGHVYYNKERKAWYARLTYTDNSGRRRSIKRKADSKTHGEQVVLPKLISTFDSGGHQAIDAEKMSFDDLADFYSKHYVKPAEYLNGRKVDGLRSHVQVSGYVKVFREYFGGRKLKSITYEDLRAFRSQRLNGKTHQSSQRSIATVNRELAYLRRILNIAERNDWIIKNPFKRGDALIHLADERCRDRILTKEEESSLLSACSGCKWHTHIFPGCTRCRPHLRPLVVAGLDTGCRLGELLKLKWRDVNFEDGTITLQALNTKTMRERQVSMTIRLRQELETLYAVCPDPEAFVFGVTRDIRQGFGRACREAGLKGVNYYTLRHTAATRLVALSIPLAEVSKVLGHTTPNTSFRYYLNVNLETTRRAAAALDSFNSALDKIECITEAVN
jgi:integrase